MVDLSDPQVAVAQLEHARRSRCARVLPLHRRRTTGGRAVAGTSGTRSRVGSGSAPRHADGDPRGEHRVGLHRLGRHRVARRSEWRHRWAGPARQHAARPRGAEPDCGDALRRGVRTPSRPHRGPRRDARELGAAVLPDPRTPGAAVVRAGRLAVGRLRWRHAAPQRAVHAAARLRRHRRPRRARSAARAARVVVGLPALRGQRRADRALRRRARRRRRASCASGSWAATSRTCFARTGDPLPGVTRG